MSQATPRGAPGVTAAILAGGLGTRLRSAVDDRPKVLAHVAGRPFITYLLDALDAVDVRRVVLLTGYRGEQVRSALGEYYNRVELLYSEEPSPLGTGGALRHALPLFDTNSILILNGDSYFGGGIAGLLRFHQRRGADMSLALTRVEDASRYGQVKTAVDGRILTFAEKGSGAWPGWINAGVYVLERRLLEGVPTARAVSLERELLPDWMQSKGVYGRRRTGPFLDIGTPESYAAAEVFCHRLAVTSCTERTQLGRQAGTIPSDFK